MGPILLGHVFECLGQLRGRRAGRLVMVEDRGRNGLRIRDVQLIPFMNYITVRIFVDQNIPLLLSPLRKCSPFWRFLGGQRLVCYLLDLVSWETPWFVSYWAGVTRGRGGSVTLRVLADEVLHQAVLDAEVVFTTDHALLLRVSKVTLRWINAGSIPKNNNRKSFYGITITNNLDLLFEINSLGLFTNSKDMLGRDASLQDKGFRLEVFRRQIWDLVQDGVLASVHPLQKLSDCSTIVRFPNLHHFYLFTSKPQ